MAKDDMHVIMYKILAYLYQCMKDGEKPKKSMYAHDGEMFDIPYAYWVQIMDQLAQRGYIGGFETRTTWHGDRLATLCNPEITMEGVEFLKENSMMNKALEFLKATKEMLPFV